MERTSLEDSVIRDSLKAGVPYTGNPKLIEAEGEVQIGTPLRDASVDPQPDDYVVPTNAGEADPHGPAVRAITVDSPQWAEFVARDRAANPDRYRGSHPYTDPGSPHNPLTPR